MQILIMAATSFEIGPLIGDNKCVDILVTGVGMPATIYQLQKKLALKRYDYVVQAGIAGAFSPTETLGAVMLVEADTFGDLGMEEQEQFTPIFQSGFVDANAFPFTDGWLINQNIPAFPPGLKKVRAVTINKVTDNPVQSRQLQENFQPVLETMEGAAFHYVCLQEKVSFLQVRSISNYVGDRNKANWKMKEAIQHLNNTLVELIDLLRNEITITTHHE